MDRWGGGRTWHAERQIDTRGIDKVCGCGFDGRSQPLIQDESVLRVYNKCKLASPWSGASLASWHCLYSDLPFWPLPRKACSRLGCAARSRLTACLRLDMPGYPGVGLCTCVL